MKSGWRLITILGVLVFALTGCENYNLVIRGELRGKWETKSIREYGGSGNWVISNLPTDQIETQSWLIEDNTITRYCNGEVVFKGANAHSDMYGQIFLDIESGIADYSYVYVMFDGNILTLEYYSDSHYGNSTHRDTCKKVNKFSWE